MYHDTKEKYKWLKINKKSNRCYCKDSCVYNHAFVNFISGLL